MKARLMVLAIGRAISLLLSGLGVLASLTSPSVFVLPSIPKSLYGYQCVGLHTRFTHPGKVFLSEPVPFFLYLLDDMKVVGLCGIQQTCGLPFMFALFFRLGAEQLDDFMGLPFIQTVFLTDSFDKLFTGFISFLFELPDFSKSCLPTASLNSASILRPSSCFALCSFYVGRMGFQFGVMALISSCALPGVILCMFCIMTPFLSSVSWMSAMK